MRIAALCICLVGLSGCATIIEGTSQTLTVTSEPPAASCTLTRAGQTVGAVPITPGSVVVSKSHNDIDVGCSKAGYDTGHTPAPAHFVGTTFLNLLLGGVVGFIVDASSGANFAYPPSATVILPPAPGAAFSRARPTS